jgi:radical SAM superfamily enzyme YgiQ (UPF0313 family)
MKRILFLTTPNLTIIQPKVYQELSWGSCLMTGALENAGFEVDFFDLNIALCKIRDKRHLSDWEKTVLTDFDALKIELENPGKATSVQMWIDELLNLLDLSKHYDCIALSLEKKGYDTAACMCVFNFATLLTARLKKYIKAPVVVGGKDVFKELGVAYVDEAFEKIPDLPFNTFFLNNAHESFISELKLYMRGEGKLFQERFIDTRSSFKSSAIVPKYDIGNLHQMQVKPLDIFPPDIVNKYSRLKDIDPMMIVPYRISMGCPYKCVFCDQGRDNVVRLHDIENIVNTLKAAKKKGFSNYRWFDDNINLGMKFPEVLADAIIKEDLDILFSDSANMRHTSVPLLKKLRQAGCVKLWYGSETMSPKLLETINKGATMEDFYRTLQNGVEAEIWNGLNLIVAFPHESDEDFNLMTEFLSKRQDLWDAWEINIYRLLSGTTYHMEAEKFGIKIRYSCDSSRMSAFDEIGGKTWEERIVDAERKMSEVINLFPHGKVMLKSNDYFLYSLIRAGYNKAEIHKILDETYDCFARDGMIEHLIYNIERPMEDSRAVDVGANIMGHVVTSRPAEEVVGGTIRPF